MGLFTDNKLFKKPERERKSGGVIGKEMDRFFHNKAPNKAGAVVVAVMVIAAAIGVYFFMGHGDTAEVKLNLGSSEIFSQEDLNEAKDAAITFFDRKMTDCSLKEIRYVEANSQKRAKEYCKNIGKKLNRSPENMIILEADFESGENPPEAYEPNKDYKDFKIFVIRDGAMSVWRVIGSEV